MKCHAKDDRVDAHGEWEMRRGGETVQNTAKPASETKGNRSQSAVVQREAYVQVIIDFASLKVRHQVTLKKPLSPPAS